MTYVNVVLDGVPTEYVVRWDRLSVWYPEPLDARAFTVRNFLRSVERELAHQHTSDRMRDWMRCKGNAIVVGSFEERLKELGG